ncbi:MAG: hypothetical protein PHQ46_06850 [Negativicutes bacterium]|nr:hypothetical protein [Negativicutes bacterium]
MSNVYSSIGFDINEVKKKPEIIKLGKLIKESNINICMLSDEEANDVLTRFLIALR